MASEFPDIPYNMRKVYRRFKRRRSAHPGRFPIPERLWAAELARERGTCSPDWPRHAKAGGLAIN
jgi:hypothetical protein